MEIRPPNKLNYPAVAELLSAALGESWDVEVLASLVMADPLFDPNLVMIAREKGETLGFLSAVLDGDIAWLKLIAVAPTYRRKGLAKEMLERVEERLFGEGARIFRAGFSPPSQFFPGVPEGEAAAFFAAMNFQSRPGGCIVELEDSPSNEQLGVTNPGDVKRLIQELDPKWWPDIEERLTYPIPRVSSSADGTALCVVDPGVSMGPLFFKEASEDSIREAVLGALRLGGPHLKDGREAAWWGRRFKLKRVLNCFEFQKDLKGVFHA